MSRPRVLFIPPADEPSLFRSVRRAAEQTAQVLAGGTECHVLDAHPCGSPGPFLAAFNRLRPAIDVVFDMSGLAVTGPVAPEIPVMTWMLGNLPAGGSRLSTRRRFLKSTDSLLINCGADREILERVLVSGAPAAPLVPFAVDIDRFHPAEPAERASIRDRLGLPVEAVIGIYAGRLNIQKSVHDLLRLVATAAGPPELHLLIAGAEDRVRSRYFPARNDGYQGSLLELVDALGLAERVHFLGDLGEGDLAHALRACDLFLSLSLHQDENFGFAPIEAMASGIPCLVSDWGGYRDSVLDGETGSRVPTLITAAAPCVLWRRAVDPLLALVRDPVRRRRLGAAARERAVTTYSLAAFATNLLAAVRAAAGRRDRPGNPGSETFVFHPLARRMQARNALLNLQYERSGRLPDPRLDPQDHELFRFFLGPYATADVSAIEANADDQPGPLAAIVSRPDGWATADPMWPLELAATPERTVLLAADGRTDIAVLARRSGLDLLAEATELARYGVIDLGRPYPVAR